MGTSLRVTILFLGITFFITVIYLLVKRRICERNSLLWLIGSIAILIISFNPSTITAIASFIGVDYPPALLFLFSILILLFIILHHSVQISVLNEQVRELTQYIAMQDYICKEYRKFTSEDVKKYGFRRAKRKANGQ